MPMKILFLHGWHSIPGGVKPSFLIQHGHKVINPALDDDDFDQAEYMADAQLYIQKASLLVSAVNMIDALPLTEGDTKGDLYEYLLS